MDFSNASPDVQDVNTLLQNLLDKFYPAIFYIVNGSYLNAEYTFTSTSYSKVVPENDVYKYKRYGNGGAYVNTTPKADFTNYSSLVLEFSSNSYTITLGFADQSGIESSSSLPNKINGSGTSGKIVYDISQITGEYYIYLLLSGVETGSFVIDKLYLE